MNKRALYFGLVYSALVIIYKLIILLGGYTYTKFGFYYSNLVSNIAIIPFFVLCVQQVRNKEYGGYISGREAIRLAFTVLSVSIVVLSAYHYFEAGSNKYREVAETYYRSDDYRNLLLEQQKLMPEKIKTEDIPKIIEEQISSLSPFKAATFKIIPMLIFGLGGAFMTAISLRKKNTGLTDSSSN